MIKMLIAEDNTIVRNGIVRVLEKQLDLEVVGEAENGVIALQLLQDGLQPDVVLTDMNMPGMSGLKLLEQIEAQHNHLPTIILTMHADRTYLEKALAAGVRGYLLKNGDMDELVAGIRDVHKGLLVVGKEFV